MKKSFLMTAMLLSSVGLFAQNASAAAIVNNLAPVLAGIIICSVPILIVFFIQKYRYKENKAKIELMRVAIENGQSIPEDFFEKMNKKHKKKNNLQHALECIGAGIGISIMLWFLVEPKFSTIGLMIFCMGLGYLTLHFIEKRQENSNPNNTNKSSE